MFVVPYICQQRLLPPNLYIENSFRVTLTFDVPEVCSEPSPRSK